MRNSERSRRYDIITGCKPGFKVYRTWTQVIEAMRRGEHVIKTSRNAAIDKCYANQFSRLLRNEGVQDIRYGSPSLGLGTTNNTYTVYLPKGAQL